MNLYVGCPQFDASRGAAGYLLVIALSVFLCQLASPADAQNIPVGRLRVELERVVSEVSDSVLGFTLDMATPGDGSGRKIFAEQGGRIRVLDGGTFGTFLDLTGEIYLQGQTGLFGMEFHPGFADPNSPGYRKFYTYHSVAIDEEATVDFPNPRATANHHNVITEWQVDANNPNVIDVTTRREVLREAHIGNQHHGGTLEFGPDGYLYGAFGTPATGGANLLLSQDPSNILGKIYRIDPLDPALTPDSTDAPSANGKYRIPADNPFVGDPTGLDEVFAYGLRNPYRFSLDQETGLLFVGDVGQGQREEVNVVPSGGNMGWPYYEGTLVGNPPNPPPVTVPPIAEYTHADGQSVIGGYVYRGSIPELQEKYLFAEFSHGPLGFFSNQGRLLWLDPYDEMGNVNDYANIHIEEILVGTNTCDSSLNPDGDCSYDAAIASFATDDDGELYVIGMRGNRVVVDRFVSAYVLPEGDYNEDGSVDSEDYEMWKSAFGTSVPPGIGADGNRDRRIDAADYIVWRNNLLAGEESHVVPEPSASTLLLIALLCTRRRRSVVPSFSGKRVDFRRPVV